MRWRHYSCRPFHNKWRRKRKAYKRDSVFSNGNAVSSPVEFLVAFVVLLVGLMVVFGVVNHMFVAQEAEVEHGDYLVKAMEISERLMSDVGDWNESDPANVTFLGLACGDTPDRARYGILDPDKVNALGKRVVNYTTAKMALGIESYDFYIEIVNETGTKLLSFGKSFSNLDLVTTYKRNVYIYNASHEISVPASMTIRVFKCGKIKGSLNGDPIAYSQNVITDEDIPKDIVLEAFDPDLLDILTYTITVNPSHGSLTGSPPSVTYIPDANYYGSDDFDFEVDDNYGGIDSAHVDITVDPVQDDPVAVDDTASVFGDSPVDIDVLDNDYDVDGDAVKLDSIVSGPGTGSASIVGSIIRYDPTHEYIGTDSFVYKINDGHGGFGTATVFITACPTDGWYCSGNVSEYRDYSLIDGGCEYIVTGAYDCDNGDGWNWTDSYRWVNGSGCCDKRQRKQEYRDYYCEDGSCAYDVTNTNWVDTGESRPDDSQCSGDGWYWTDSYRWVNGPGCCDKKQRKQEYRDYYCSVGCGCTYDVTNTDWVDTGESRPDDSQCSGDGWYPYSGGCFLAGTKIMMADGSSKNIEEVRVGEMVKSMDMKSGVSVDARVVKAFHHAPGEMIDYYLVINDYLSVTPNHPLSVNNKWMPAGEIKVGDRLLGKDGEPVVVESIKKVFERVPTFNLEVDRYHNYFAEGVLVHNKEDCLPGYVKQEYRDYSCSGGCSCQYSVTDYRCVPPAFTADAGGPYSEYASYTYGTLPYGGPFFIETYVTVSGSVSSGAVPPYQATWTCNGQTKEGLTATFTFGIPTANDPIGTYTATLSVVDAADNTASDSTIITILNPFSASVSLAGPANVDFGPLGLFAKGEYRLDIMLLEEEIGTYYTVDPYYTEYTWNGGLPILFDGVQPTHGSQRRYTWTTEDAGTTQIVSVNAYVPVFMYIIDPDVSASMQVTVGGGGGDPFYIVIDSGPTTAEIDPDLGYVQCDYHATLHDSYGYYEKHFILSCDDVPFVEWATSIEEVFGSECFYEPGTYTITAFVETWDDANGDPGYGDQSDTDSLTLTVTEENHPPTLSSGSLSPSSGDTSTTFTYRVTYTDPDDDAPTTKYVYIASSYSTHTMTKVSGSYASGAVYEHSTTLSAGDHEYWFQFNDGHDHSVRLPSGSDRFSGPSVSNPEGYIEGHVYKSGGGGALSGAYVSTDGDSDTTDGYGSYDLTVTPDYYTVTASKSGYQSQSSQNTYVGAGQTVTMNFWLSPDISAPSVQSPYVGMVGETWVTLEAQLTDDGGEPCHCELYIMSGESWTEPGTHNDPHTFSHTFYGLQPGTTYWAHAQVWNSNGSMDIMKSFTTDSTPIPPVADISSINNPYEIGETITFDAINSYDPDGTIVLYHWNFGDGSTYEDDYYFATHSYSSSGTYTVTLTVTDNDDLTDTDYITVQINQNQNPEVSLDVYMKNILGQWKYKGNSDDPEVEVRIGRPTKFVPDAYDPDGYIAQHRWYCLGNGGWGSWQSGEPTDKTYSWSSIGYYGVTLQVEDDKGATDQASVNVHVILI